MPAAMVVVAAAVVLLSFSGGTANGVTKRWTPNVDFEDPNNWDAQHVPSSVDVTVFQEDTVVPVVLPSAGIDVCELVLPVNGQLILEPDASIVISTSSKDAGGCTGQTVKFKRTNPMEWVDPDNWSNENTTQATPHVERVPCEHDTVKFNPGNSFSIIVPDVPINIGSMEFGNQTFSQDELDEFLLTDIGDQELKSSSPENDVAISLTSTSCDDNTGCECGTQHLLDHVCKVVYKRCTSKLGCISPVKPIGHCCLICGAYFILNYDPRVFNSQKLNEEFEKDMTKIRSTYENHQFFIHMSKLLNGRIQIVLVGGTTYEDEINEIAKTMKSILSSYEGIMDVKMFDSGLSYNVDGMTYGQIALTTFMVIIVCMLTIIFYHTNDWLSLLFSSGSITAGPVFVKFENETNDVELITENRPQQRKTSFDNPTYSAVENLTQSQTFDGVSPYSDLSTLTMKSDPMDVELKERSEKEFNV